MSSQLVRWGGLAAMVAGAILIVAIPLIEVGPEGLFYLMALVTLLLIVALPALHVQQAGMSGRLGLVGFILAFVGAATLTVLLIVVGIAELLFGYDPEEAVSPLPFLILVAGFFALLIGSALFGIDTARAGVLPRWGGVLFALGLPLALGVDLLLETAYGEEYPPWGAYIGFAVFGIGLIWLGYTLWSGRESSSQQSPRVR